MNRADKEIEKLIEEREVKTKRLTNWLRDYSSLDETEREVVAPTILDLIETPPRITFGQRFRRFMRHNYGWFLAPTVIGIIATVITFSVLRYNANYYPLRYETSRNARFGEGGGGCIIGEACVEEQIAPIANENLSDMQDGDSATFNGRQKTSISIRREGKRFLIVVDRRVQ
jgi:hypothetical protein